MSNSSQQANSQPDICIVGAGLAGSMCALMMARRGAKVTVIEGRPDFRDRKGSSHSGLHGQLTDATKRSINLALSTRGLAALERVQLANKVKEICLPMHGRQIHFPTGDQEFQAYGQKGQFINSVSRSMLNQWLLEEVEQMGMKISFRTKFINVGKDGTVTMLHDDTGKSETCKFDLVIGADGAFSKVRDSLGRLVRQTFSKTYIDHGYKELNIPPTSDGDFAMNPEALHIWPRHEFMMIALPNPDKSFTCTLFMPFEGEHGFDSVKTADDVKEVFQKYFSDAVPLMPQLVEDYMANPTSSLITVRCEPWNYQGKVVLIGDAAHAIVPFYGQGMNAAFEDCLVLDDFVAKHGFDFATILPIFAEQRKEAANALANLSLHNYVEMRSSTAKIGYRIKRVVDRGIHSLLGNKWLPLYSMVSFSCIPYNEALARASHQDALIGCALKWMSVAAAGAALVAAKPLYRQSLVGVLNSLTQALSK